MCGIAGILNLKNKSNINSEDLKNLIYPLKHRGPDEFGAYIDNSIGLVHSRLSIIDLEGGTQPIHNKNKTLWIVYNGEVYNYPELKSDLIKKGHKFYTSTDTEVVLHLYEEKGIDCLKELNGQFAFAVWDTRKKELFLARDRLGIKPLHYTVSGGQFIFASEIKSIFTQNNVNRSIDINSLNHMFRYWSTIPGKTIFEDINELPPAHYLKISANLSELKRYWDIPFVHESDKPIWSLDTITGKISELLLDSIKIRLRADVTVGGYLSGGLDSSVIAEQVKNNFNNELKTFGIRFTVPDYDEGSYQNQIVKFLDTTHEEVVANNINISNYFSDVIWHTEKPLLRTAPVPMYLLSKHVNKSNIKVVLTGEGADEFFGGYNIFREAKARHFWAKVPNSVKRSKLLGRIYPYIFGDSRLNELNKNFFGKNLNQFNSPYFSHLIRWDNTNRIRNLLNPPFKLGKLNDELMLNSFLPNDFMHRDYFERAQYLESMLFLSNYLLSSQGDRVAMANSVEIRLPFLDHRLMELLSMIPSKLKIYGMNEKFLLKRTYKQKLPEKIINRHKHPYRAPVKNSLLAVSNRQNLDKYCSEDQIKNVGIFKPDYVKRLFDKAAKTDRISEWEDMAVAAVYSTQVVHNKFINNYSAPLKPNLKFDLLVDNARTPVIVKRKN